MSQAKSLPNCVLWAVLHAWIVGSNLSIDARSGEKHYTGHSLYKRHCCSGMYSWSPEDGYHVQHTNAELHDVSVLLLRPETQFGPIPICIVIVDSVLGPPYQSWQTQTWVPLPWDSWELQDLGWQSTLGTVSNEHTLCSELDTCRQRPTKLSVQDFTCEQSRKYCFTVCSGVKSCTGQMSTPTLSLHWTQNGLCQSPSWKT